MVDIRVCPDLAQSDLGFCFSPLDLPRILHGSLMKPLGTSFPLPELCCRDKLENRTDWFTSAGPNAVMQGVRLITGTPDTWGACINPGPGSRFSSHSFRLGHLWASFPSRKGDSRWMQFLCHPVELDIRPRKWS